jgi:thioredoxin-related protein
MSKLEKATYLSMMTVCLFALYLMIDKRFVTHRPNVPAQPKIGALLPLNVPWKNSQLNVVIAMTSDCRFCQASMPLYHQVSDLRARTRGAIALYVASTDSVTAIRTVLAGGGVNADDVIHSDFSSLGVRGTPTVFLTDSYGKIVKIYNGKLDDAAEQEFLTDIQSAKVTTGP